VSVQSTVAFARPLSRMVGASSGSESPTRLKTPSPIPSPMATANAGHDLSPTADRATDVAGCSSVRAAPPSTR
jgi:hypothetical protein